MATEATMFPMAIGLAGSFDRQLMEDVQSVIAREVRARGVHLALSPVLAIARDPRWGRIEETFGEDPYLCGEMGVAAVRGLQGGSRSEEHTSELQPLMRISYAVFCLPDKKHPFTTLYATQNQR